MIPVNKSELFVMVDDEDFERISKFVWWSNRVRECGHIYRVYHANRTTFHFGIANTILNKYRVTVDHINRNPLDNRKENLRVCTSSENHRNNTKTKKKTTSKYKGVSFHKTKAKWIASIRVNESLLHLGYFLNEDDAAKAYDTAALKYFKEFASINFPP